MEAVEGNNRQRSVPLPSSPPGSILSLINRDSKTDHRISMDPPRLNTAAPAMVSPTMSTYSNGPPPPPYSSSGWSGPPPHSSGYVSPPDSRRTSDPKHEASAPPQTSHTQRQSLPSIHEALTGAPKANPYTSSPTASLPPTSHQCPYSQPPPASTPRTYPPRDSIPRTFPPSDSTPRTYPPSDHSPYPPPPPPQSRQPSPTQPIHSQSSFPRPEPPQPNYPDTRHPPIQAAPGPQNPYAPRYEPSRYKHDPRQDSRPEERFPNGYVSAPPPQQPAYSYGPSQGPPPGPHGPMYNQPRYPNRDPIEMGEPWKGEKQEPVSFRQGVKRHLDVWDFENNLAEINIASTQLREWSAHYNAIAQEQQRSVSSLPERMPSLDSVNEMMRHSQKLNAALVNMTAIIKEQQESLREQQLREQSMRNGPGGSGDYDDGSDGYGDDMKMGGGYGSEGKKRRGRAAPPGRCHSCNRAETPEWRRGPDGARTLCNACGLHYAKLTRKNAMKQQGWSQGVGLGISSGGSSLRPKSNDGMEGPRGPGPM